jgi:excinuclease ABC subunit A
VRPHPASPISGPTPGDSDPRFVSVRGAREHNLKGFDVAIPRDCLVVVTGPSGSGKSSLAFDTLYAEGQRRYVESLSAYARQFLEQMEKPDVEWIDGLSPSVSIEQRSLGRSPRSTVGTTTEIWDYLRLLFARVGRPHCPTCQEAIAPQSAEQMADRVLALPEGTRAEVLAPVVRGRKGEYKKELAGWRRQGFVRARIDGALRDLAEDIALARTKTHEIEIVVDRIVVKPAARGRLVESIGAALELSGGFARLDAGEAGRWLSSAKNACPRCGFSFPELAPRSFSFNSPHGACGRCGGLGSVEELDPERIVPDAGRPLLEAIDAWGGACAPRYYLDLLASLAAHFEVDPATPWRELPERVRRAILHGTGQEAIALRLRRARGQETVRRTWDGVLGELARREDPDALARYRTARECGECGGSRLRLEARCVRLAGVGIHDLARMSIAQARAFLAALPLGASEARIAERLLAEIGDRLRFLSDVGLDYLTLDRPSASLSGGESQRIRLATQVGASLMGVLYVLDEPSIGLHARDNQRLLASLAKLRDIGNSVIVVEHDEATIRAADHVIDMGLGAGIHGGEIVAQGSPEEVAAHPTSLTGAFLSGRRAIPVPKRRRPGSDRALVLTGCSANNLKDVTLRLPLGVLTVVTGVSGSGKSTLVTDTLYRALAARLHGLRQPPGRFERLAGLEHVDKVIEVSQDPIGRTPRSNPATYTGVFDGIRRLFTQVPESRVRGYGPGRFSFNVKGGRCESCHGDGQLRVEMHFLPDLFVTCEVCRGRRYNRETLEIQYRGRTIADVLAMTVEESIGLLDAFESLRRPLRTLADVGLGYIQLGQSATTLSGGEAQRVKLARELARRDTGRTLYVLDEPTTGLHFADVERLLQVLDRLVELGNSVVVIEHHLDVIKTADHVIDLGPEGGEKGGEIVAAGTPEEIARHPLSHTGRALAPLLFGA